MEWKLGQEGAHQELKCDFFFAITRNVDTF